MEATAVMAESLFLVALFLLVLTYLIYPLVAVVIGAGRVEKLGDDLPAISLLVPAHNEAAVLAAKIENFRALDYPPELIELVVADDGSTDDSAAIVNRYAGDRIRLVKIQNRGGKSAAMNCLVDAARHPFLLFSDANVMLARNAVRRMVDHLANERVGAITGEVRLVGSGSEFSAGEALYYWLERRIQGAEARIGSVMGVDGGMYLIRREVYSRLPADTLLDDFVVSIIVMRSRRRVIYESAAKATEGGTPTARQEFGRRVRIAAGAVQLIKRGNLPLLSQPVLWLQFISHKLLRWLTPVLLLILLVTSLVLQGRGPWYQVAAAIQVVLYAAILSVWLVPSLRRNPLGGTLFYFGISQVAMAVGLAQGLLNRQSPKWDIARRWEGKPGSAVNV